MKPPFPALPFWPTHSTARRTGGIWLLALVFVTGLVLSAGAVAVRTVTRRGDEAIRARVLVTGAAIAQAELMAERSCQRYLLTGDGDALAHFEQAQNGIEQALVSAEGIAEELAPWTPSLRSEVAAVRKRLASWQSGYALPAINSRLSEQWSDFASVNRRGGQAHWISEVDSAIHRIRAGLLAAVDTRDAAHAPQAAVAAFLLVLGLAMQCGALALVIPLGLRSLAAIRDRSRLSIALKRFTSDIRDATSEGELSSTMARTVLAAGGVSECSVLLPRSSEPGLMISTSLGREPGDQRTSDILKHPSLCPVMNTGRPHMVGNVKARRVCDCALGVPAHGGYTCLPLVSHGRTFGLVNVQTSSPRGLSQAHVRDHFEAIGFIGALAMADHHDLTRMQHEAMTDVLTGLYNRRFLEASLAHLLAVASRNSTQFTILMMDLDHFKQFNDAHGHAAGDALLAAFGNQIKPLMRDGDILARYGGEEFVAVLPGATDAQAEELGNRLRRQVWDLVIPGLEQLASPVATLSMGLASFPGDASSVQGLLKVADRALYQAKEAGRDRIQRLSAEPVPV